MTIKKIGTAGVTLIRGFEGFSSKPYRDAVGVWTIGYGHTEGVSARSRPLSRAEGEKLLQRDLDKKYAPYVSALRLDLNQNQFDALVSFVYNVGPGGIASSTQVGRALRQGNYKLAADKLLQWDKAGGRTLLGLTRRRKAERALFLTPVKNTVTFSTAWLTDWERTTTLAVRRARRDNKPRAVMVEQLKTRLAEIKDLSDQNTNHRGARAEYISRVIDNHPSIRLK